MVIKRTPVFLATIQINSTLVDLYYIKVEKSGRTLKWEKEQPLKILFHPHSTNKIILMTMDMSYHSNQEQMTKFLIILVLSVIDKIKESLNQYKVSQENTEANCSWLLKELLPIPEYDSDKQSLKTESVNSDLNEAKDTLLLLTDKIGTDVENATYEFVEKHQICESEESKNEDGVEKALPAENETVKPKLEKKMTATKISQSVDIVEKITWHKTPQKLENLFLELHEAGIVNFYDLDMLSEHFEFDDSEESEHEDQDKIPRKKIKWLKQQTKLMFLFEYLRMKGVISFKKEKIHELIFNHFCRSNGKDFNTHTLSVTLSNINEYFKFNFKNLNRTYREFKNLIDNHI